MAIKTREEHFQKTRKNRFRNTIKTGLAGIVAALSLTAAATAFEKKAEAGTISGRLLDIDSNPVANTVVEAIDSNGNLQQIYTNELGYWSLGQVVRVQPTTWGGIKDIFFRGPGYVPKAETPVKTLIIPTIFTANPDTLYYDCQTYTAAPHWNIKHPQPWPAGDEIVNAITVPRTWTNTPYFTNVTMDADVMKETLFVIPHGLYSDNLSWATSAQPIPIDGTFTQANIDSLNARIADFQARTGTQFFRYASGEVDPGVSGAWWFANDLENNTTPLYTPDFSMYATITKTTPAGFASRTISEHEMARILGVFGLVNNSQGGITNASPNGFRPYDAAVFRFIYKKRVATESGQNSIKLSEMY